MDLLFRVTRDCYAASSEQLPLSIGEFILCENDINRDWFYGCKLSDSWQARGKVSKSNVVLVNFPQDFDVSSGETWIAVADFIAQQSEDLNLLKGDLIVGVRHVGPDWLEGRSGLNFSKRGIFPSSFAKQIILPATKQDSNVFVQNTTAQSSKSGPRTSKSNNVMPRAKVIAKLEAKLPEEISLDVGEFVYIDRFLDKFYCEGRTVDGSRRGIFPRNFVQIEESAQATYENTSGEATRTICSPKQSSHNQTVRKDSPVSNGMTGSRSTSPGFNIETSSGPSCSSVLCVPHARAKFDFTAEFPEELSFDAGRIVKLLKHVDEEWLLGEVDGKKGIVPRSFIEVIVECPKLAEPKSPQIPKITPKSRQFKVLHEFPGFVEGDLRAELGDVLILLDHVDENWIRAMNTKTGMSGMIPISFLVEISDAITSKVDLNHPAVDEGSLKKIPIDFSKQMAPCDPMQSCKPKILIAERSTPSGSNHQKETSNSNIARQMSDYDRKKSEARIQRNKIAQEILKSEQVYLKELKTCLVVFQPYQSIIDAATLLESFDQIVHVSEKLIANLENQLGKDFVYQEIGAAFVDLQMEFRSAYGHFCQTHEGRENLILQYQNDESVTPTLQKITADVQREIVCMDLHTMLNRPVQRILAYPLFVVELLKHTDDSTSDKVKLLVALKNMNDIAQALNETKRRKDLVLKYKKDDEANFSSRLSKLNLHTFKKKSNRFSMRLTTTIGFSSTVKDDRFDQLEKEFRGVEKACRFVLKDVPTFCEQSLILYNQHMTVVDSIDRLTDHTLRSTRAYLDLHSEVLGSELQNLFEEMNSKIREPISTLHNACKGPEKLMAKRHDKLLDYESALSRFNKEKSRSEPVDPYKMKQTEEDLRKSKVEYEALNEQLKTELPNFSDDAHAILHMACQAWACLKRKFVFEVSKRLASGAIVDSFAEFLTLAEAVGWFKSENGRICSESLSSLTFAAKPNDYAKHDFLKRKSSSNSATSSDDKNIPMDSTDLIYHELKQPYFQKQTEDQVQNLKAKYQSKLFMTKYDIQGVQDVDLSLREGHIVGMIVNKDPMGNPDRCFVDSGHQKGFVPKAALESHCPTTTENDALRRPPFTAAQVEYVSVDPLKTKFKEISMKQEQMMKNSKLNRKSSEPNLLPSRVAPPPPPPPPTASSHGKNSLPISKRHSYASAVEHDIIGPSSSTTNSLVKFEFCVALYDYAANSASEMSLWQGKLVSVHAKHDLQRNAEWWLVEDEDGAIGYVPANYLRQYA